MKLIADFQAHPRHAMSVLFTHAGDELVTCGMDTLIRVWSMPDFKPVRTFEGHEKSVNGLCLTPDGATLFTGSTDRTVRVWDYATGQLLYTLTGHRNTVMTPRLSPDGRWLASPSYDRTVRLRPLYDGGQPDGEAPSTVLRPHPKNVTSVAFTHDSTVLACSGVFDEIQLWGIADGRRLRTLAGHSVAVGTLGSAPCGRLLWSLGHEGKLIAWSTDDWSIVRSVDLSSYKPFSFALSADGSMIGVTFDHGAGVVSAESMDLLAYVKTPVKGMYGAGFSADNLLMAAAAADGRCRVWALEDVRSPGTTP